MANLTAMPPLDAQQGIAQPLSGRAARIANIVTLTHKIEKAFREGERELAHHKAKALVRLLEVFRRKHATASLPVEIVEADELVSRLRGSGLILPDRGQRRIDRREKQRQTEIWEGIRTMVRRTAKRKPKPKPKPKLLFTAFESSRRRH